MTATALLTDSTWSMPPALAGERGILVLPLQVTAGPRALEDTDDNAEEIEGVLASARSLGTSQPTPAAIEQGLRRAAATGAESILGVFCSSALSGTCESVAVAAEAFTEETGIPVEVVDSLTAAAGTGLAVLSAADALSEGAGLADAAAAARRCAAGSRVAFTVPDLMHLKRGGRLPAGKALVGRALGLHPILEVRQGALTLAESVRGAAKASARLRALTLEGLRSPARIVVLHSGAEAEARVLADAVAGERPGDEVMLAPISRTLRVHTGPGALGLAAAPRG